VLLTPVLLFLLLAVVQAALLWHSAHLADAAASRGAVVAAASDGTTGDGVSAASTFAAGAGARLLGAPSVARGAGLVRATVTVRVPRVLPLFPSSVRRTSVAPVERYVPEAGR
jgi:hypothetical protein